MSDAKLIQLNSPPIDEDGNLLQGYVKVGENIYDCEPNLVIPEGAIILGEGVNRYVAVEDDETIQRNQWFGE